MLKTLKPVLFSALVAPGCGHFISKKYLSGGAFLSVFMVLVVLFSLEIMTAVKHVQAEIINGRLAYEISAVLEALNDPQTGVDLSYISSLSYLMLLVWLVALVDIVRLNRH
jgi:hypothetical protein